MSAKGQMPFVSKLWNVATRILYGPDRLNRVSILTFHRVLTSKDPFRPSEPSADEFDRLLSFLSSNFNVVNIDDAIFEQSQDNRHRICLTFDDGYSDNFEVALPILKKYGAPATFFIASGMIDGGVMWNDRILESFRNHKGKTIDLTGSGFGVLPTNGSSEAYSSAIRVIKGAKYLPSHRRDECAREIERVTGTGSITSPMMTTQQVRQLSSEALFEIGGHTDSHPVLTSLGNQDAYEEISEGKHRLEAIIGKPLRSFAYPNGVPGKDYTAEHVEMVRQSGFSCAVSTSAGGVGRDTNHLQMPRFTPWDANHFKFGLRLLMVGRRPGDEV